ncbi:LacI family DNA-binding transcriptional regulator [Isoptericola sp. NPDC019571]|uniref:LacI family DNA-binding transcriptional regulator n=1 Tax=Isoptericola sp. NPDC019571 TaxID=3364008 RepID=UPI0037AB3D73
MSDLKRVTARDVATLAGVSPATVSKALSGKGSVHPDTRDRILAAASELGLRSGVDHQREPASRNLTVGLVTRDPFDRRTSPVLLGVLETFTEHDIAFLVCDGRGDPIREQHFVDSLMRREVDGILVAGGGRGSFSRAPLRGVRDDVPVVYMMTASTQPDDASVIPDNRGGAELAARHLLATGRRRITCILGPRGEQAARLKADATRAVLAEHGLELATEPLYGQWDEQWGRQAALQLVHSQADVDGIVCGNDVIARGATNALQAAGVAVPDSIGVIGFDNWDVMVEGNRPRLSTIDLNLPDVGRRAAEVMVRAIHDGTQSHGTITVEAHLVPRESTAAPAGARADRR